MDCHWKQSFEVGNRRVGIGQPAFIIAEAGSNHDGDFQTACELIRQAKRAGADAIKFQIYQADTLIHAKEFPEFHEKFSRFEFPLDWTEKLIQLAKAEGIIFLATPFDSQAVGLLNRLAVPAFKIASGDLTYHSLLNQIARTKKSVFLSTGMATLAEVEAAVAVIRKTKNRGLILLHCVANYPASLDELNLRAIPLLQEKFGCPIGFSDHTLGEIAALGAVGLGACVLEKHFTLKRSNEGLDHAHATEPGELSKLIQKIRDLETALGQKVKEPQASEKPRRIRARRSVYARKVLRRGERIKEQDVIFLRPRKALGAEHWHRIKGKRLKKLIPVLGRITQSSLA